MITTNDMTNYEQRSVARLIMWLVLLAVIGTFLWFHQGAFIGVLVGGFLIGAIMGANTERD